MGLIRAICTLQQITVIASTYTLAEMYTTSETKLYIKKKQEADSQILLGGYF